MSHISVLFIGCFLLVSCSVTPPVVEMGLADAALRQARDIGVETKHPSMYTEADEAYRKADYFYRNKNYGRARYYAVQARQIVEKAELRVVEATGLVSAESEVLNVGIEEDKDYFSE